jgi:hypothetical protein
MVAFNGSSYVTLIMFYKFSPFYKFVLQIVFD